MKEIKLSISILNPTPAFIDLNSNSTSFKKLVKNCSLVEEGTRIIEFSNDSSAFYVNACASGIVLFTNDSVIKEGQLLYQVFNSYEELVSSLPHNSYDIVEDEFTGNKRIIWKVYTREYVDSFCTRSSTVYRNCFSLQRFSPYIDLNLINGEPVLVFLYINDSKLERFRIKQGDAIQFLLSNGQIVDFIIKGRPYKSGTFPDKAVNLTLSKIDLDALSLNELKKVRVSFANGDAPCIIELSSFWGPTVTALLFRQYVKDYIKILSDIGFRWEKSSRTELETGNSSLATSPCYVYLMVDTSNLYHKIGISNKPEYREHTLQSEKPTIELVCAKQFPTRKIAEAIESALHSAFSDCRVRGEWFELSSEEVEHIKATLR